MRVQKEYFNLIAHIVRARAVKQIKTTNSILLLRKSSMWDLISLITKWMNKNGIYHQ